MPIIKQVQAPPVPTPLMQKDGCFVKPWIDWFNLLRNALNQVISIINNPPAAALLKTDVLAPDGLTYTFTLAQAPQSIVLLSWNGQIRIPTQFSVSGTTLTTVFLALASDDLVAYYQ